MSLVPYLSVPRSRIVDARIDTVTSISEFKIGVIFVVREFDDSAIELAFQASATRLAGPMRMVVEAENAHTAIKNWALYGTLDL